MSQSRDDSMTQPDPVEFPQEDQTAKSPAITGEALDTFERLRARMHEDMRRLARYDEAIELLRECEDADGEEWVDVVVRKVRAFLAAEGKVAGVKLPKVRELLDWFDADCRPYKSAKESSELRAAARTELIAAEGRK